MATLGAEANTREAVEVKVKLEHGGKNLIRTFVVEKDADIRMVGSSILVQEGALIRLMVPAVSVVSILPVLIGNQISGQEAAEGKSIADGETAVLG